MLYTLSFCPAPRRLLPAHTLVFCTSNRPRIVDPATAAICNDSHLLYLFQLSFSSLVLSTEPVPCRRHRMCPSLYHRSNPCCSAFALPMPRIPNPFRPFGPAFLCPMHARLVIAAPLPLLPFPFVPQTRLPPQGLGGHRIHARTYRISRIISASRVLYATTCMLPMSVTLS